MSAPRDEGFTLPELLAAITILGIIMVAIAAMITTSFRTSETVSAELQGSRAPKMVARYWVPDAEQATAFAGAPCGAGSPVATFTSPVVASAFDPNANPTPTGVRSITWSIQSTATGRRQQLVRTVCEGSAAPARTVVVSELEASRPANTRHSAAPRYVLTVSVPGPDHSVYTFDVAGTSQVVTTTTSAP